jgi:hypothetical protein
MYAVGWSQNPELIATLLKAGADATVKSNTGKAALECGQNNTMPKAPTP